MKFFFEGTKKSGSATPVFSTRKPAFYPSTNLSESKCELSTVNLPSIILRPTVTVLP